MTQRLNAPYTRGTVQPSSFEIAMAAMVPSAAAASGEAPIIACGLSPMTARGTSEPRYLFAGCGHSLALTLEPVPGFILDRVKEKNPTGHLRSSELADLCGLSTDTLRHYERKGLLRAGRSANGYREYPPQSLDRIRLVQHALSVGFTLDELARLLKIREKGGAPCKEVRELAAAKLKDLEEQLRSLSVLRNELRAMLARWDTRLSHTRRGQQAYLLDMLQSLPVSLKNESPGPRLAPQARRNRRRRMTTAHSRSGRIEA
jgi:MerR family copper efflux transcriptional regulator